MEKALLFFISILATVTFCKAQEINMFKARGGDHRFAQYGKEVSMEELSRIMEPDAETFRLIKKARNGFELGNITAMVAGGFIGYPLGAAIAGGEPKWTLVGIGAGLLCVAFPVSIRARKNAEQAVDLFNSSLSSSSHDQRMPALSIRASGNAIGLSLAF